jgi:hypothetical protein
MIDLIIAYSEVVANSVQLYDANFVALKAPYFSAWLLYFV